MKSKIIFIVLLLCIARTVDAQSAGDFDPGFATIGYRTDIMPDEVEPLFVYVMQDGRIVSAGISDAGSERQVHLFRYLTDGSPDTTLAQTGELIAPGPEVQSDYFDAAVQPDGKILLYYEMNANGGDGALIVVRLNVDGSEDQSFGNAGWSVDSSQYIGYPGSMVLQADGKIVMTGIADDTLAFGAGIFVRRLLANGQLDTGYGNGGWNFLPLSDWRVEETYAAQQSDGKILVSTLVDSLASSVDRMVVCRFMTDGTLDTGYGVNGKAWDAPGTFDDVAMDMAISPQDEIYILGHDPNTFPALSTLVKFDAGGVIDMGFGTNGYCTFGPANWGFYGYDMVVQPDGKIVVSGEGPVDSQFRTPFALARILPSGVPDISFGTINGYAYPAMNYDYNGAYAVALQPDGKIVVAGGSYDPIIESMTVARYLAGPVTAVENTELAFAATIFPNPATAAAQLHLNLPVATEVSVSVWDMMGREVLRPLAGARLSQGLNELPLDLNGLGEGTYLVRVAAGEMESHGQMESHGWNSRKQSSRRQSVETLRLVVAR